MKTVSRIISNGMINLDNSKFHDTPRETHGCWAMLGIPCFQTSPSHILKLHQFRHLKEPIIPACLRYIQFKTIKIFATLGWLLTFRGILMPNHPLIHIISAFSIYQPSSFLPPWLYGNPYLCMAKYVSFHPRDLEWHLALREEMPPPRHPPTEHHGPWMTDMGNGDIMNLTSLKGFVVI